MNKMSFVIPCYNAKEHIQRNINYWKQISEFVNLIWIEDTSKEELKDLVREIGGEHYSKENGNWGSVVNYAIKNKLVKTEYVAIVDPDDIVDVKEFATLNDFIVGHDLYITKYVIEDFKTSKRNVKSYKFDKYTFIHQLWFKTSILNTLKPLPEGIPFTDNIVVNHILASSNTALNVPVAPYRYFVNFDGQSTAGGYKTIAAKIRQSDVLQSVEIKTKASKRWLRRRLSVANLHIKYHDLILLRSAFESERDSNKRKEIIKVFSKRKPKFLPIRFWMLWSRAYVAFRRNDE